MPKVLIFKETLLPVSETFILAQMGALSKFTPKLAGLERVDPSLPIPEESLVLCKSASRGASLRAKVYRRTGVAPWFHRAAKQFQPDLLHAHFASGGRSALALARTLRVPLVVTLHGSDVTTAPSNPASYEELGKEAAQFLCVSAFIRDRAIQIGFPREKLLVHYIGVDQSQFVPSDPQKADEQILFIGRLVEKKGCAYLIRAMQAVNQARPKSELKIIGDGPLKQELELLAKQLGIRCVFMGSQPGAVVRQALREARVLCAPSITASNGDSEGLPTVLAEAQATGVPAVSTIHAGIPEIIQDGKTGFLVPERDVEALSNALIRLLNEESLYKEFHEAAISQMRAKFDLQTQTAELEKIYTRFLNA